MPFNNIKVSFKCLLTKKTKKGFLIILIWHLREKKNSSVVDTVAGTIELPPHRVVRLHEMLASFPRFRRTCSKRDLQKLVGELRSMIVAIPGGVGCMSWL